MRNNKLTKHEEREAALALLFGSELGGFDLDETLLLFEEAYEIATNESALALSRGVTEKKEELDGIISRLSPSRALNRIPKINLMIMRIALYEILYSENIPNKVAIDEAIELSKEYADKNDSNFIGGLLGSYYREINSGGADI